MYLPLFRNRPHFIDWTVVTVQLERTVPYSVYSKLRTIISSQLKPIFVGWVRVGHGKVLILPYIISSDSTLPWMLRKHASIIPSAMLRDMRGFALLFPSFLFDTLSPFLLFICFFFPLLSTLPRLHRSILCARVYECEFWM